MNDRILRWAANWRLWLALSALAVMAVPVFALVAAITIIGIPITIVMMLIPGAAFLLLPAALLKDQFARLMSAPIAWIVALGSVVVAAAASANAVNGALDREVEALAAGDIDAVGDAPIRSLALVTATNYRDGDTYACKGVCLRLLLAGAVEEVLLAGGGDPFRPNIAQPAIAVRFERGAACRSLRVSDEDVRIDGETLSAPELARRRIAAGDCLVERDARLGNADAIIAVGKPRTGAAPYAAGLNPLADTVSAYRLSFSRRLAAGLHEEYRQTGVIAYKHAPIMIPTIVTGYAFEAKVGFARIEERRGFPGKYENEPDVAAFLDEKLRLDLRLDAASSPDLRAMIDAFTARRGVPLSVAELAVADDFLASAFRLGREEFSREDAERATRLLERIDYELTFSGPGAVRTISAAHPDLAARLADAQFQRLFAADPAQRESRYRDPYIPRIALAIALAPDEALRARRIHFSQLAADPARRALAASALARLSVFGIDAEDDAIGLVDAALADRVLEPDNDRWRDLYGAGLKILCEVRSAKGAAALKARIAAAPSLAKSPHGGLLIATLVNAGMTDEEVMAIIAAGEDRDDKREDAAREIRQTRKRPECAY